jgi:hypothetical protein
VLVVCEARGCACGADTALAQHIIIHVFYDTAAFKKHVSFINNHVSGWVWQQGVQYTSIGILSAW